MIKLLELKLFSNIYTKFFLIYFRNLLYAERRSESENGRGTHIQVLDT